jgi:CIC family chloride channel protein
MRAVLGLSFGASAANGDKRLTDTGRAIFGISNDTRDAYAARALLPEARGSGIPQTKTALFIRDGQIAFRTVVGRFFCCSAALASRILLGQCAA